MISAALTACATTIDDEPGRLGSERAAAIERLQAQAGAPVALEVNEVGTTRVIAMTPQFHIPAHTIDPAEAANSFLANHAAAFGLDAADAASFVATRVDVEPALEMSHVTLQRTYRGIPVFQGAITVHMDGGNGVFRALGDEFYRVGEPTNRMVLTPAEAALAAGKAAGVALALAPEPRSATLGAADAAIFRSPGTLDPIKVEPRIVQLAPGDDRFAYQVLLSYRDEDRRQQYDLMLVDADDGTLLDRRSLVNRYSGRVWFSSPGANPASDNRAVRAFDPATGTSPLGWVDASGRTRGNNVVSATDRNGNNTVDTSEIQPVANGSGVFDFLFDPAVDASRYPEAAVTNAFYFANLWHDRAYQLGFTETAGNFQTSNFGKGGAEADEVQQDVQDSAGLNDASFATPPDGSRPRMQLYLFNRAGGPQRDSAYDPTVVYHENTHGMSNRLVGGGSTGCLGGIQSAGMGEGWSDYIAASFASTSVIGAYVSGNATNGLRHTSIDSSPFSYSYIKDGTLVEAHDVGEVWAATLRDMSLRNSVPSADQLVVAGMKLTPCNPTMLQARDAILQADAVIRHSAQHCQIWRTFANRGMGLGASSPSHSSTSAIVTSTAVPAECVSGTTTRTFVSTDVPRAIPDNSATGTRSIINVTTAGLDIANVTVDINITHPYRGDLVVQVIAPSGQIATLSNFQGGSEDNFLATNLDITSAFTPGSAGTGLWQLFVRDLSTGDTGTINAFVVRLTSSTTGGGGSGTLRNFTATDVPKVIPDADAIGVRSTINVTTASLDIRSVTVDVNITHTFRGDLVIQVIAPNGQTATLSDHQGGSDDNFTVTGSDITSAFTAGSAATGAWQLFVRDTAGADVGTINSFALHIRSSR